MPSHKPLIGVTGPVKGAWPSWILTKFLIWKAGGRTVHITTQRPTTIENLSGLILGGGADIDPGRYKEKMITSVKNEIHQRRRINFRFIFHVLILAFRHIFSLRFTRDIEDKPRDELEFSLLQQAIQKKIPILGICRGAQLINVFFGGTLFQDNSHFYTEEPELRTVLPRVTVMIEPNSQLHKILQKRYTKVNSLHHQSVDRLGHNLKIVARETSGVVEAVEHTSLPFVIGLQWHPEFLPMNPTQRKIFKAFLDSTNLQREAVDVVPLDKGNL
jgi:putative glutamine amidotransferase